MLTNTFCLYASVVSWMDVFGFFILAAVAIPYFQLILNTTARLSYHLCSEYSVLLRDIAY